MSAYPRVLEQVIEALQQLPGIGAKTAERLAFHLLKAPKTEALNLAAAIAALKEQVQYCQNCYNLAEHTPCGICADAGRDRGLICVVEEPRDVISIEKTGRFRGTYHVLLGRIAPLEGQEAKDLTLDALEARLAGGAVTELILATNPDMEGDVTALHIAELAARHGVRSTRLARGIPTGTSIEYSSTALLGDAIAARQDLPAS